MYETFPGKLTLQDGSIVGAVLTIGEDLLTISAEGITVGTWPLKYCRVARETDDLFRIAVDGEPTYFRPADAYRFAEVAAQHFRASSLADRIDVIRSMPPAAGFDDEEGSGQEASRTGALDVPRFPLVIGAAVVAVAALITIAGFGQPSSEPAVPAAQPTTTRFAAQPDTAALTSMSASEFVIRWNREATTRQFDDLVMDTPDGGSFARREHTFNDFLWMEIASDTDEQISSVAIHIDPRGNINQNELATAALGVAVAVADPTLTPQERAGLLRELGLDGTLQNTGSLVKRGVVYDLTYIPAVNEATFEMAPA